jgi:N-methylhydantoinase B
MRAIDPITLEIMRNRLQSIADEMTASLVRTTYSTNIKDRRDCSCALVTTRGEVVAQTELGTPFHLGVMPAVVEVILRHSPLEKMRPGDAIFSNILYPVGPGHLNDVTLVSPLFYDGEIVALMANQAHHVDVGGYAPGSMAFGVTEIFQEGLQIPPVKLVKEEAVDPEILSLILQNIRTARVTRGDIAAQVAANNVGLARLAEVIDKEGKELTCRCMEELLDYAERSMRAGIRGIPDGAYTFEDCIEGDGITEELITIRVKISIKGDSAIVDFKGTDGQVRGPMNLRISAARACTYYVLKSVIDPELPTNSGAYRPIEVLAEEGSLVNARYPAALCNANILTDQRIVDVLLGAMLKAVPERVCAACSGEMNLVNIGGVNPRTGEYFNYVETYGGGQGALHCQDGMDGVQTHLTNTRNAPVEVMEVTYPFRVDHYGLAADSEGAGKYRGGCGIEREIVLLGPEARLSLSADRRRIGPWGVKGGKTASTSDCIVVSSDGRKRRLPSKVTTGLRAGDRIWLKTPGGGGWGDPKKREPRMIEKDVKEELISADRALKIYGWGKGKRK